MNYFEIPLSRGGVALVDEGDLPLVAAQGWFAVRRQRRLYAAASLGATVVYMHRIITGAPQGLQVDHRNHDGLDNRRANLRLATHKQNGGNQAPLGGRSRFKGVYQHSGGRWAAQIRIAGRKTYLGLFNEEEAAARAYDVAAIREFGDFAATNAEELGLG